MAAQSLQGPPCASKSGPGSGWRPRGTSRRSAPPSVGRLHILHRAVEPPRKTTGKPPENGKTAGKPLSNCRKTARNRWETAGKPPAKPLENRRRTAGKPPAKPPGDHWQNCWKTARKPLENRRQNRWKTAGTTGKTVGKRRETTGKTAGKPLESRQETTGKTVGKPPKTAGESPVFGSLLPVSISDRNGRKGSLRRHFSAPGGGCHKGPAFQAQLMYFSKRWGWRNGDLRVFRRDEGPSRSDDGFCGISR